jgi:hypothetical protein
MKFQKDIFSSYSISQLFTKFDEVFKELRKVEIEIDAVKKVKAMYYKLRRLTMHIINLSIR